MSSNKPVVRQRAWLAGLFHILLLLVLGFIFGLFSDSFIDGLDLALIVYFIAYLLLRFLVPRNHRQGVAFFKSGNYTQAISEFEKSYDFFTEHAWIDKYRFIVLLSSSRISYTEMALVNIAFCYTQIGNGGKAKEYYEKTLSQFPDSGMAQSALRMMQAVEDGKAVQ